MINYFSFNNTVIDMRPVKPATKQPVSVIYGFTGDCENKLISELQKFIKWLTKSNDKLAVTERTEYEIVIGKYIYEIDLDGDTVYYECLSEYDEAPDSADVIFEYENIKEPKLFSEYPDFTKVTEKLIPQLASKDEILQHFRKIDSVTENSELYNILSQVVGTINAESTLVFNQLNLHPYITKNIVMLFQKHNMGQLIFSTNDVQLLAYDILEDSNIYFTENNDMGETICYSANEFNHSSRTVYENYIQSRLGATPFIELL